MSVVCVAVGEFRIVGTDARIHNVPLNEAHNNVVCLSSLKPPACGRAGTKLLSSDYSDGMS